MRYYKGDLLRKIEFKGNLVPRFTDDWLAKKDGYVADISRTETAWPAMEPHYIAIVKVIDRPWHNHLRAAWDSIFKP